MSGHHDNYQVGGHQWRHQLKVGIWPINSWRSKGVGAHTGHDFRCTAAVGCFERPWFAERLWFQSLMSAGCSERPGASCRKRRKRRKPELWENPGCDNKGEEQSQPGFPHNSGFFRFLRPALGFAELLRFQSLMNFRSYRNLNFRRYSPSISQSIHQSTNKSIDLLVHPTTPQSSS